MYYEGTGDWTAATNLLGIIAQIIEILLERLNVSREEAEEFTSQVKGRKVGELFANLTRNMQIPPEWK